jgi:hypothetical protein
MAASTEPSTPTTHAAMGLPAGALVRPSLSVGAGPSLHTGLESIHRANRLRARPDAPPVHFGRETVLDQFVAGVSPFADDTLLDASHRRPALDSQRAPVSAHDNIIDTTKLRLSLAAPPIQSKKQIVPLQHGLDLDEEERQRIEIALNAGGEGRQTGRRRSTMGRAPSNDTTSGTRDTVRSVARRGVPAVNALSGNAS